jgi:hypothetical protein
MGGRNEESVTGYNGQRDGPVNDIDQSFAIEWAAENDAALTAQELSVRMEELAIRRADDDRRVAQHSVGSQPFDDRDGCDSTAIRRFEHDRARAKLADITDSLVVAIVGGHGVATILQQPRDGPAKGWFIIDQDQRLSFKHLPLAIQLHYRVRTRRNARVVPRWHIATPPENAWNRR